MATTTAPVPLRSTIPARLDRLRWSPFHTRMVAGLGAAWILDGLQITISSSVTGVLSSPKTLGMSSSEIGLIASVYLIGEVVGALYFGRMSDRIGRKRLLIMTLLLYLCGTGAAAFVTGHHHGWLLFFYATRFVAGMGIGGQYAAINSAIDEMMPSKYRGRVDIWINGTYWAGAIIGSFVSLIFLNAFAINVGWRLAFLMGPVLALVVIVVGRTLPESPRWLMTHGRVEEAERELAKIEDAVLRSGRRAHARRRQPGDQPGAGGAVRLPGLPAAGVPGVPEAGDPRRLVDDHPVLPLPRDLLHLRPGSGQLLRRQATKVPVYGLAFSVGNLLGPLLLGRLFDTIGRKPMIAGTYLLSGGLLLVSAWLFGADKLKATTQTLMWVVIFFFASAGASAAYLTVSETWPIEIRAEAIAVFFAIAQIFGALGALFYGVLIGDGQSRTGMVWGYIIGGLIMAVGGVIELLIGVRAESQSLETVTKPLTAVSDDA